MKIFPVFIPFAGCKNKCVFCDQRSITAARIENLENDVFAKLSELKEPVDEIAFFGGSFTGLSQDLQLKILRLANEKTNSQSAIRISTYPEFINSELLKLLYQNNVRTIELGVQSLDSEVLKKTGRHYNIETVEKASLIIKSFGFKLGHQIMAGLPGSTIDIEIETIKKIKKMQPDFLRIYPLVIIKNTELEKMYIAGEYQPLNLEEIIDRCVLLLNELENTGIKVIRIGLHSETAFVDNSIVNKESYHPSLGELVKSEYIFRKIKKIKNNCNSDKIKIKYLSQFQSIIIGNKKKYLKKYNELGIYKFEIDNNLGNCVIVICAEDSGKMITAINYDFLNYKKNKYIRECEL